MQGKEMIRLIEKFGLEEMDLQFSVAEEAESFPTVKTFKITGVSGIGHSEKTVDLEGELIK